VAAHYATGTSAGRAPPALVSRARDTARFVAARSVWSVAEGQRSGLVNASGAGATGSSHRASPTELRRAVKPRAGRRAPSRLIARTFNAAAEPPADPSGLHSKPTRSR
jgi:hypothetical protein